MRRTVVVAYVACALIWGTTWFSIRVCLTSYPTFDALALRFLLASAVLLPIALRMRPWPTRSAWAYLILAGVLDAIGYAMVYLGEERVPGGVAAVVYGTQPLVLAVSLTIVRIEKITRRHLLGALISLAGVVVLFLDRMDVSLQQAVGVALVFVSVIISTAYSIIMKRHAGGVHAVVSTWVFLAITALVLGAIALTQHEPVPWPPDPQATIALVYLALIGSVVAFLAFFWLLGRTSLLLTSTLVFFYPLIALLTDRLFDRAIPLGPRAYVGAAIVLGGLAVSLRRG